MPSAFLMRSLLEWGCDWSGNEMITGIYAATLASNKKCGLFLNIKTDL
jgi:hypothetical protein